MSIPRGIVQCFNCVAKKNQKILDLLNETTPFASFI